MAPVVERDAPLSLAIALEREHGPGWVDFEPETLMDAGLDDRAIQGVLAVRQALYDPNVFRDWHVFALVAAALCGLSVDPALPSDPDLAELAWAVTLMRRLDPISTFSSEIQAYLAGCAIQAGLVKLPPPLDFADPWLYAKLCDHARAVRERLDRSMEDPDTMIQRDKLTVINDFVAAGRRELVRDLGQLGVVTP